MVGEDQVDMNIQVPIEIINLPASLTIANEFKKNIDVSVRGPRSMILDLRNRNITRPVDLSNAQPGTIVIKNDETSIPLPKGILVQRLQPTNITLLLDQLSQKNFPVKPITEGKLAAGYELRGITLAPDHLVISGPRSILDKEQTLRTYAINLNDLDRATTVQIHLNLGPEFFDLIGETVVTAQVELQEKLEERTVNAVPVTVREARTPVKIKPQTVAVRASFPQNLLHQTANLTSLLQATVTANGQAKQGTAAVVASGVSVPGHDPIKIISVTPAEVEVTPLEAAPPPAK